MKTLSLLAFLTVAVAVSARQITKGPKFKNIGTLVTDLNSDGKMDTIVLSSSIKESGFYNRISVSLAGFKKRTFNAKEAWTEVDKDFLDSNKNSIASKLLFVKKTAKHAVILLFGVQDGAGYRAEFSIINIENNNVKLVFEHGDDLDVEAPETLADLGHNGRLCFVFTSLREMIRYDEKTDSDVGSYEPYYVYPVTDSCDVSMPLSIAYNKKHYVYVGPDVKGEVLILYPHNKKGKIRIYKGK